MARKTKAAKAEPQVDVGAEIFASLRELEKIKGIPVDYMVERLKQALANAYRKDREDHRDVPADNVIVNLDEHGLSIHLVETAVTEDELEDLALEIPIDAARRYKADAQPGDQISIPVDYQKFGRIAAQTAKQVVIQGIREAERGVMYESYSNKSQELMTGTVFRTVPATGDVLLKVGQGNDASEAMLRSGEQIPGETYTEGQILKVYVLDVRKSDRAPWCRYPGRTPTWCAVCSSWRPRKSLRVRWRSATSPGSPAPAPRWPSGPLWRASTPWVPAWAPEAAVSMPLWKSSTARRSKLWCGARTPASM